MTEKLSADYSYLDENFKKVREDLASAGRSDITLLAATKTVPAEAINYAIDNLGLRYIGENRVQELLEKYDDLHKENLHVHFIGTLQVNKVKYIADKVEMIHSLDSEKLAAEIDKRCRALGKVMDVLIEVNVAEEEQKSGISPDETSGFIEKIKNYPNLRCRGLMTMAPAGCTDEEYRRYFAKIYRLYLDNFGKNMDNKEGYILSMGMSGTYKLAAECGSTLVRVGSALFGARNYN